MSLTPLQRDVCRLLAEHRLAGGEQYVAGGLALNHVLGGARVSRDVDLFHDTLEAVAASSASDRAALRAGGFALETTRELEGFVEVVVRDGTDSVEVQWVRDSAFRFFPLVLDEALGLTLHPFDLATNKVLALVGRVAVRDWVDVLTCHAQVAPLGCLFWAASGKDAGLGPRFILEEAARTSRYSAIEFAALDFDGARPDPAQLGATWREALADARTLIDALPADRVGCAVVDERGAPLRGDASSILAAVGEGAAHFHAGALRGAVPVVRARPR